MVQGDQQPRLRVRDLGVDLTLEGVELPVIRDVNFDVAPGEILGVVGESGSGKSITALSVMGMLPRAARVAGGEILYDGTDLTTAGPRQMTRIRGREIGMVFQDPLASLNPLMTVGQQIREVLVLHGANRREAAERAIELLDVVGVHDPAGRVDDYPHQFSGGMRQRVIIAIAVANNPRLLIADEPTTALDVTVQAEILRLLAHLRDQLGSAVVLISHDTAVVEEICDRMMVMYAGRVVEHGRVDEVMGNPRHPYTRELMRSSLRLDRPRDVRPPTIPGQPPDLAHRPGGCAFHPRCPVVLDRCPRDVPPLMQRDDHRHTAACWITSNPLPATDDDTVPAEVDPPRGDDEVLVTLDDVRIAYETKPRWWPGRAPAPVVDGVSLQVRRGRALGLVGESGSGKSTVAKAIVGLLPVQSGVVRIEGRGWSDRPGERLGLSRSVQMVFQDPYQSLNPRKTILQTLAEPLRVHRIVAEPDVHDRVVELLGLVGLSSGLLRRFPYQLSGGQRQRVGIARALALEPTVIVADEPVSSLDVSVQAQIINLLADLRDELGLAYLLIAHDLSVVRQLCEDVAVMQHGRIVEHGDVESIFTRPQHVFTRELLAASPGSGPEPGSRAEPGSRGEPGSRADPESGAVPPRTSPLPTIEETPDS